MLILLLLFIGLLFVSIGWIKSNQSCPAPIVEYRYVPRTFKEEQENPTKVSEIFEDMFNQDTPWMNPNSID
jgi:hypothetical protein